MSQKEGHHLSNACARALLYFQGKSQFYLVCQHPPLHRQLSLLLSSLKYVCLLSGETYCRVLKEGQWKNNKKVFFISLPSFLNLKPTPLVEVGILWPSILSFWPTACMVDWIGSICFCSAQLLPDACTALSALGWMHEEAAFNHHLAQKAFCVASVGV